MCNALYFKPGEYHPGDDDGFALLAHELTHVLQYRQRGFADFTCEYGLDCAFGADPSCAIEAEAYNYQALVLDDRGRDGDGVFTKVDNCPDDFNPGQEDADGDGIGDACDPGPIARLYDGANRSGDSQAFPIGSWDVHALTAIGNDRASSISVDPGLVARLCAEDGLWGDCFDFHQGQDESAWFKSYAQILDNRTSSLSVTPGVTVYQYPNFDGNRWTYTPGSYNHAALQNVLNDQLSSLITAPGILVRLCSESGGWGDCITVEGDTEVATLPAGMNDRTSHIAVSKGVTVYTDAFFQGQRKTFAPGTYDVSALGVVGNDRISSLVVPPGLEVQLCSESSGWGTCRTFRGNVSFVGPDMDDRTSWLQVRAVDHSSLRRPISTLPMTQQLR